MINIASYLRFLILLMIFGLIGCEKQKDEALEYFQKKPQPNNSNLERFGFRDKPTPIPTKKIVIPFDNERTREGASSN